MEDESAKAVLSRCVRRFDLEARQRFAHLQKTLTARAADRKAHGLPPTAEEQVANRARREIFLWMTASYFGTYGVLRFLSRNKWPKPGLAGMLLKSTLGGFAGGMAGAATVSAKAIPEMISLDESATAEALCPALAAFKPCMERSDCRQLLLDNTKMVVNWHELCRQRDSRLGRSHPNDGFDGPPASSSSSGGNDGGMFGEFGGGGGGGADSWGSPSDSRMAGKDDADSAAFGGPGSGDGASFGSSESGGFGDSGGSGFGDSGSGEDDPAAAAAAAPAKKKGWWR